MSSKLVRNLDIKSNLNFLFEVPIKIRDSKSALAVKIWRGGGNTHAKPIGPFEWNGGKKGNCGEFVRKSLSFASYAGYFVAHD